MIGFFSDVLTILGPNSMIIVTNSSVTELIVRAEPGAMPGSFAAHREETLLRYQMKKKMKMSTGACTIKLFSNPQAKLSYEPARKFKSIMTSK